MKCPRCQFDNATGSLFCSRCGTQLLVPRTPPSFTQTATLQTPFRELVVGGTFAGRYQILEELGRGGMGRVYKAYDTDIKEHVALKLLNPEIAADEGIIERFRNELKFARRISHRHVCRMFDLGKSEETAYISMEFVSGEDLKTLLKRVGQLPVKRTVDIAEQVAEGLAEAHRLGVVHRDLKPQNVMIDRDGNARIMDFGIARSVKGRGITDAGVIIGTPDYMSPEQFEGQEADQRSDIYSFGAVLYEMVIGEPPFEGETPLVVAAKHKTEQPRDPHEINPQIPEALSRLILRCLEKEPERRFSSADEILTDLKTIAKMLPGTRRTVTEKLAKRPRRRSGLLWIAGTTAGAVIIAAFAYIFFGRASKPEVVRPSQAAAVPYKSSIAVLPFQDLSPQRDQEAFSTGITDDLITKLASVGQLKVISRTSVMRFKSTDMDIREIGRELGVETILEGSIQREKDNIRVNVKLSKAQDGSNIWAESYDRKVESIFTIQDEISKAVVNALRIELVAGQDYMLVKRYTQDPDAYNLYLEGRLNWNRRTEEGLNKSIELYQMAIAKDPNFALAYAGIADAFLLLARTDILAPRVAYPKAKEAVERALEIDDALAEGYAALAFVKYNYDWDWMGAEIDFNWAIGLNPNYATAYQYYGSLLASLGRFEEALAKLEKAKELDPSSVPIRASTASLYIYSRQPDLAVKQSREIIKMVPDSHWGPIFLGEAELERKSFKKAIKELEKGNRLAGAGGLYLPLIAYAQAASGNRAEAQRILEELIKRSEKTYIPAYSLAYILAAMGDKDRAFEYLEKAYEEKSTGMILLKFDPWLDPLRDDPRFNALLERMNLR